MTDDTTSPTEYPLCDCGNQMLSPISIKRGYCERCRIASKELDPPDYSSVPVRQKRP